MAEICVALNEVKSHTVNVILGLMKQKHFKA